LTVEGRDIIGIAQMWATDNVNDAELSIEGYTLDMIEKRAKVAV